MINNWQEEDLKYIWHPCSQMKDYEGFPPIIIDHAKGINLYDIEGKCYKDVVSSWWCNLLGHCNPRISNAIKKQLQDIQCNKKTVRYTRARYFCKFFPQNSNYIMPETGRRNT